MEGEKARSSMWDVICVLFGVCILVAAIIFIASAVSVVPSTAELEHQARLAELQAISDRADAIVAQSKELSAASSDLTWWEDQIKRGIITRNSPGYLAAQDRYARAHRD